MTNDRIINVSFEITDNWNISGFRNFIKLLQSNDNYNIFIISNDNSAAMINSVGVGLGLDSSHIVICNFTNDKIQAIEDNNIDIHLDNLQSFVLLVDETTDANGVLVTKNLNRYYLQPDYVIVFDRILKEITDEKT